MTKDDEDFWTYSLKSMSNAILHTLFAGFKKNRVVKKKKKVSAALSVFIKSRAISLFLSFFFLKDPKKN